MTDKFPITFTLNTGHKIPAIGLGTWQSEPGKVGAAVKVALEVGYRHIDCAYIYDNEKEVGEALAEAFQRGTVKREELFITSKLWPTDYAAPDVEPALKKTLGNLKLDYLDLYLTHIPVALKHTDDFPKFPTHREDAVPWDMEATWRELEKLHDKGLVKSIGVSNFSVKKLEKLLAFGPRIIPAVNQVELHPEWRNDRLVEYCQQKGIHITAYSPLGSKKRPQPIARKKETPAVLELPAVKKIAEKLGKSPAQVVLKWGIQRGTSVLPKSVTEVRIKENFDVVSWNLSKDDFAAVNQIEPQVRLLDFRGLWVGDGLPVATLEDMWDGEVGELAE